MPRYGQQQGSAKGYNKHKPGRKSEHPIMAFVAGIEMVANFWLRSGDAHRANNFKAFSEETLLFLKDKKIGLLGLDSGFYSKDIFEYPEEEDRKTDYITAADVWRLYRGRANCENRIKELKYDYGPEKMNQSDFDGTEAALLLMTVAYNFLSLFKQLIIGGNVGNRLKTLRHKMLAIPSIIENNDDGIIVKMALHMNRRNRITKLCDRIQLQFLQSG